MTVTTLAKFDRLIADIAWQAKNATEQGRLFEDFVKLFMENGSMYPGHAVSVERWESWARRRPGANPVDTGIDLVASVTDPDGERESWGIQVKYHESASKKVDNDTMARIIAVAGQPGVELHRLIVVSAGDGSSSHASATSKGNVLVDVMDRPFIASHLDAADCPDSVAALRNAAPVRKRDRRVLRSDQERAVAALSESLVENPKTQYISACGTGKTVVSAAMSEAQAAQFVLFAAPRLSLVEQTVYTYREQYEGKVNLVVLCSDGSIGRRQKEDDDIGEISEQRLVVRDADELVERIASFDRGSALRKSWPTVVLTTYHSAGRVLEAQERLGMPEFDLMFCDEAHYLVAAEDASKLGGVLVDAVAAKSRIFATATPRVVVKARKNAEYDRMNEERFGPRGFRYTFGEAISDGVLSDYTMLVSTVPDDMLEQVDNEVIYQGRQMKKEEATALVSLDRARAQGMRRFVTFHRTVKAAKTFSRLAHEVLGLPSAWVDGSLSAAEREARLSGFDIEATDTDGFLVSNARVLTEGIDIPRLDAVMFVEPLRSPVSIAQAVGRVMRKHDEKEQGYIIVPVLIPAGQASSMESVKRRDARYESVVDVVMAMAQHDKTIADVLVHGRKRNWDWSGEGNGEGNSRIRVTGLDGASSEELERVAIATEKAMDAMQLASFSRMEAQVQSVVREAANRIIEYGATADLPNVGVEEADYSYVDKLRPELYPIVEATFAEYDLDIPDSVLQEFM